MALNNKENLIFLYLESVCSLVRIVCILPTTYPQYIIVFERQYIFVYYLNIFVSKLCTYTKYPTQAKYFKDMLETVKMGESDRELFSF